MDKKFWFCFFLTGLMPALLPAQAAWWRDVEPSAENRTEQKEASRFFRTITIDSQQLLHLLDVPAGEAIVLHLPTPDGGIGRFSIRPDSLLPPGLSDRFPSIRVWTGLSANGARLQLDCTPNGFHAMVLQPDGDFFIDPSSAGNEETYLVYRSREAVRTLLQTGCLTKRILAPVFRNSPSGNNAIGDSLFTYRLAVAATGEYTQFFGGEVEKGLAAIVTTLHRVNGIYQRDLSVRFQLVDNNDVLIFTDPDTDPYSRNNEKTENQEVIDSRIGSSNYDIGHVFGITGDLSLAEIASACDEEEKAMGKSRLEEPTGDPFDVDIVAHEIGHQLGANHTFNKCGDDQGVHPVEPGSGSTIMGWAGVSLCGEDNMQEHSDAYFHTVSIEEITGFVTEGQGRSCATVSTTGNHPPEVEAGTGGWIIPTFTPFELIGQATDPDGETLIYTWEQVDEGPSVPVEQPAGLAPLFRSRPPAGDSVRVFPDREALLQNKDPFGEVLPPYNRPLNFRLTVRDQRGGVAWDSLQFETTDLAGPFRVTSFNQPGVAVQAGETVPVSWSVAGTDRSPVAAERVDIYLSSDGGRTFPLTVAEGLPNSGFTLLTFPDTLDGDDFRLKIKAAGNIFFDINDADFAIQGLSTASRPVKAPPFQLYPNPVTDILWIVPSKSTADLRLTVLAVDGRKLKESKVNAQFSAPFALDIGDLAPGVYFLQFSDGRKLWVQRVVKR